MSVESGGAKVQLSCVRGDCVSLCSAAASLLLSTPLPADAEASHAAAEASHGCEGQMILLSFHAAQCNVRKAHFPTLVRT